MYKPQSTILLYTGNIADHGTAKGVSFHALAYEVDEALSLSRYRWHYVGEVMPSPLPYADLFPGVIGFEQPEILFPPALHDLPAGEAGLYDLARSAEFNVLSIEDYKPQYSVMLNTDSIEDHGVAHDVSWYALVWEYNETLSLGRYRWHYFGTVMPDPLPDLDIFPDATGMQHPPTHFPSALANLPEGDQGLYSLALSVLYYRMSL